MEAERYKKLDELFDLVLEVAPAERQTYLLRICGEDSALRRDVEALLQAYEKAANFIEKPAIEVAAKHLAQSKEASLIGEAFGHYRMLSLLGAGGMGEVYLAEDSRLARKVALKLLPAAFTRDPDRVIRFQRESRAASALNHPNIITIYEIGQVQGIHFIASEFIEGDTLRQCFARGPLLLKDAVDVALQTASALSAAHAAGIVHRDIKPENLMIRRDRYVKVLDFGLAKLAEQAGGILGDSLSTKTGAVMGTIKYMSPEQALGQEIDQRTDIFSFGVVLYEMVTGQQPFAGATPASTFNALLNEQPAPVSELNPEAPAELESIIYRTLEKDRELRYQTAADLRADLKRLQRNLEANIVTSAKRVVTAKIVSPKRTGNSLWKTTTIVLALALALLLGSQARFFNRGTNPEAADWREAAAMQVTDFAGAELFPSLSPDGKSLVFASRLSGNWDIYWKRVGTRKTTNLTDKFLEDDSEPAFSPDGRRIAFRSSRKGGGIFVMTETGESPKQLTTGFGHNPSWSPDGKEIVCTEDYVETSQRHVIPSRMWVVNTTTGESRLLPAGDAAQASWSPRHDRIAYWGVPSSGTQRDIWTISAQGGDPVQVTDDAFVDFNPVWSHDGNYLYFVSNRRGTYSLWRIAIDEKSGGAIGQPEPVPAPAVSTRQHSLSSNGKRLAYVHTTYHQTLYRLMFDPVAGKLIGTPATITQGTSMVATLSVSPDGSQLCFISGDSPGELSVLKIGSQIPDQLTDDTAYDLVPRWAPDGKQILFYSNPSGIYQIYSINSDGSGRRQLTEAGGKGAVYGIRSPVDSRLAFSIFSGKTMIMDLNKPYTEQTLQETPFFPGSTDYFVAWDWSPDGAYLIGNRFRSGVDEPGLYTYSLSTQTYEKVSEIGIRPLWLKDSRRIIFISDNKLFLLDCRTKAGNELINFNPNQAGGPTITGDNRAIYLTIGDTEADIWLLSLN